LQGDGYPTVQGERGRLGQSGEHFGRWRMGEYTAAACRQVSAFLQQVGGDSDKTRAARRCSYAEAASRRRCPAAGIPISHARERSRADVLADSVGQLRAGVFDRLDIGLAQIDTAAFDHHGRPAHGDFFLHLLVAQSVEDGVHLFVHET
jgi:hypothetical protein